MNEANLPTKLGFKQVLTSDSNAASLYSNGGMYLVTVTPTTGYGTSVSFTSGGSTVTALSFYVTIQSPTCISSGTTQITTAKPSETLTKIIYKNGVAATGQKIATYTVVPSACSAQIVFHVAASSGNAAFITTTGHWPIGATGLNGIYPLRSSSAPNDW
jgi:hypothetical protein